MVRSIRLLLLCLAALVIFGGPLPAVTADAAPSGDTITKKQRDIILLMCAMENPNYDIVLAIDVSDSMSVVLPEWKKMAEKTIDLAQNGDTMVLIRFDSDTKPLVIQQIEKDRDKELFKGKVFSTATTKGWGTDIRRAYWLTLKTLKEFNDGRAKKGEPVRLQQVVFISDGDDLPPDRSPFRNPGSAENIELADLLNEAQRSLRINIIPIGMTFENYVPKIRTIKQEGVTTGEQKISNELKQFMEKMEDVLSRKYGQEIKEDNEQIPRAPFQFYITWLSNRLELKPAGPVSTKKPFCSTIPCQLTSRFIKVKTHGLAVEAAYRGTGGGMIRRGFILPSTALAAGSSEKFDCKVDFPKNWSFTPKEYKGEVELTVRGDMDVEIDAGASGAKKQLSYSYPLTPKTLVVPLSGKLPPCLEFLILTIGGLSALVAALLFFIYRNALPMSLTLKTEQRARAFNVKNGESISLGANADFELDGAKEAVATIKRQGRLLTLILARPDILAESTGTSVSAGSVALKFGQSFNLNVDGTYITVQVLEGDQEDQFAVEQQIEPEVLTGSDEGTFNF